MLPLVELGPGSHLLHISGSISQWGGLSGTFHTFLMYLTDFSQIMTEECAAGQTLMQLAEIFSRCRSRIKFFQLPRTGPSSQPDPAVAQQ